MKSEVKVTRNPFPMIGKVFKYEFLSTARIFVPIYGVLLVVALLAGLFLVGDGSLFTMGTTIGMDGEDMDVDSVVVRQTLKGLALSLYWIFTCVAACVVLVSLARRFKKGMLGNEGYLNWTLPVTVGEHLCGRLLSALAWVLSYSLIAVISFGLFFVRLWKDVFDEDVWYDMQDIVGTMMDSMGIASAAGFIALLALSIIISTILFILFIYFVYCVTHLVSKHRMLLGFVLIIICFSVAGMINNMVAGSSLNMVLSAYGFAAEGFSVWRYIVETIILDVVYAAFCGAISWLILRFKLNLE